ncbi:MAG: N-acetyltransferase [Chloroflexi bacterium]|nr:MAG: N-acetyltransferase [Chloroflexota bacterium]
MMETIQFRIRYATPADNTLLAELGAQTFADSFAADNTPENMRAYIAASFSSEKQALELADSASKFLIIEVDGAAVGYAQLHFGAAPSPIVGRKPVEIVRLYARTEWIGKGVGAQLMKACFDEAVQAGCDVVWLGVWERNPRAIAFYRKWGFEHAGTQVFQLGDERQTDWLMARPLSVYP